MADEFLGDRRKALEEEFFARHNRQLLEKLRDTQTTEARRDAIAAATGITDPAVLDRLAALELTPDELAALALVPLVEVAWADGSLDRRERNAVLSAAEQAGHGRGSASYQLLEDWLRERPPAELLAAWKAYVSALSSTLTDEARQALKQEVLGRARRVAEAAGGFLGLGGRVSRAEEAVLKELEQAFTA